MRRLEEFIATHKDDECVEQAVSRRIGGYMRRLALFFALLPAVPVLSQTRSFTGEIMDSQCAAVMKSHTRMMQGLNAKNAKDCTQKCVGMGGKYTLLDPLNGTAYQLDSQDKAEPFAGQKVVVKGTLDSASKTIHVESIEAH
jgi:hypothetical protein